MVLQPCDGVVAVDIAGCPVASRLRSLSIPLGDQYRCCTVIGVTLFGIIFYLFIVIAGTVSEDCTYQAPATHIFRHIVCHNLPPAVRLVPSFISSKFSCFIQVLERCKTSTMWGTLDQDGFLMRITTASTRYIPTVVASGAYSLVRVVLQSLVAFCRIVVHWFPPPSPEVTI